MDKDVVINHNHTNNKLDNSILVYHIKHDKKTSSQILTAITPTTTTTPKQHQAKLPATLKDFMSQQMLLLMKRTVLPPLRKSSEGSGKTPFIKIMSSGMYRATLIIRAVRKTRIIRAMRRTEALLEILAPSSAGG